MADVDSGGGGGRQKKGGPKTKKKSTRIDMTAMVDVAFLLLTFFVLTATMTNSGMMEMVLPPKIDDPEQEEDLHKKIAEEKIMTLILDKDDKVYYYTGIREAIIDSTDYSEEGLREVLHNHIKQYLNLGIPLCEKGADDVSGCWDPIFVFKPRKEARFKNLVDLLDELDIVGANKFTKDEFSETDSLIMRGEFEYVPPDE